MRPLRWVLRAGLALLPLLVVRAQTIAPGLSSLPAYNKVNGLEGSLRIVGSDGHLDIATAWAEAFKAQYSNVAIQVEGGGSGRGPTALRERTAQFGLMARPMTPAEKEAFGAERAKGVLSVRVATDVLAVFVHKDNPLNGLALPQLERIFGAEPRSGAIARTWGDLGVTGDLAARPFVLFGRNPDTGVFTQFRNVVLGGGGYRAEVQAQVGPSSVVRGIGGEPAGIGYAQLRTRTTKVRALALGASPAQLENPSAEAARSGAYPLAHPVFLCFEPGATPMEERLRTEFLRFILSQVGQSIAQTTGLIPLTAESVIEESRKLP